VAKRQLRGENVSSGLLIDRYVYPFHATVTEVSSVEIIDFVGLDEFEP
jgi:hypothetical protein